MVEGVLDYGKLASSYNELYEEEQVKKLELIKKHVKIIPPLLDVGCGTGISTNYFNVESVGVDSSKEMIKGKENLVYGKAENLPFEDKSFNTVISVTSFHHFDMKKALDEMFRVSNNGNIAISFLKKSEKLKEFRKILGESGKYKEFHNDQDILFVLINLF